MRENAKKQEETNQWNFWWVLLREEHLDKKDISSLASCLDRIYTFLVLVLTWKRGYKIIFCTLKKLDALSIQRKAQPQKEDKEEKNK